MLHEQVPTNYYFSTHQHHRLVSSTIHLVSLTSAAIKANVLTPLTKTPTPIETISMKPDRVRIADRSAISRKWDHPGVVGEKDSWREEEKKSNLY